MAYPLLSSTPSTCCPGPAPPISRCYPWLVGTSRPSLWLLLPTRGSQLVLSALAQAAPLCALTVCLLPWLSLFCRQCCPQIKPPRLCAIPGLPPVAGNPPQLHDNTASSPWRVIQSVYRHPCYVQSGSRALPPPPPRLPLLPRPRLSRIRADDDGIPANPLALTSACAAPRPSLPATCSAPYPRAPGVMNPVCPRCPQRALPHAPAARHIPWAVLSVLCRRIFSNAPAIWRLP